MRLQIRQTQAVAILAALTIAAIVLSVTFLIWQLRENELEHARLETSSLTEMLMDQTQQSFASADLVLQGVQERLSNAYGRQFALDSAATHLLLSARVAGMRQLSSIFLINSNGTVINSSLDYPMPKFAVADREYFTHFSRDGGQTTFISKPLRNRVNNGWSLYVARPLFETNGKFRGVVAAAVSIPQLEKMYQLVKLDYERPIALYLADGTLIASLPHREQTIGTHPAELTNQLFPIKDNEIKTIRHINSDGERESLSLGRLAKFPLLISVTDDEVLSLASWRETATPIGLGAALVCIFTATIAMFLIGKLKSKEMLALALRTANDLYQHTINSVMDAIVAIDETQHIVLFNPAAEIMFGRKAGEVIGQSFDMLIPARIHARHQGHVARYAHTQPGSRAMNPQLEITGRRADGQEFPIESTISKSIVGGKLQMTAVLRDVTEHRQAENDLRKANKQLRDLSTSLQQVREQERARLSRELHDELGQQLTGLKLSLSWLGSRLKDGRTATPDAVDEMRYLLDGAIASVRRISTELRPLILDDLGFGEAITWQTTEFTKRSTLEVTLNLPAAPEVEDDQLKTALFRIVQESLTNVTRHANATKVKIELVANADRLVLTISDNGQGFQDNARQGGIGLVSMRERAYSVGAKFSILSGLNHGIGAGTTIEVTIPHHKQPLNGVEA
jgi:PAS domain S-box-containing protein